MNTNEKMLNTELKSIKADAKLYKLTDKKLGYFIMLVDVDSGLVGTNSNMNDVGLIYILLNYCKQQITKSGD